MSWTFALPAVLGLAALSSCVSSEAAAPDNSPDTSVPATATTQSQPQSQPLPEAPKPAASTRIMDFSYSGELTQGGYIRGRAPDGTVKVMLGEEVAEIGDDYSFFAAFDRDSASTVTLTATMFDGQKVTETLSVSPRDWQIERVNVAKRKLRNPEAYWRSREPEHNAIVAARAKQTGAKGWQQDFIWPVTGRISGRFGRQRIYRGEPGSYHSGIDIAKPNGTPFVAPADGVVILARTGFSLEGGLLMIDHGNGLNSAFLHCSRIVVKEGDAVRQGQHIGDIGSTGRSTGPHLHWGLKWHDARFDPILLAGPMN